MTEVALILGLLVAAGAWAALQRDWHAHDWGRRRTVSWVRRNNYGVPYVRVWSACRFCRTCGESSVRMVGPWDYEGSLSWTR